MYATQADDVTTNVTEHANPWHDVPEYALAVRVFVQAIQDATHQPTRKQQKNPRYRNAYANDSIRNEAMRWLMSNDAGPMSARWISDILSLDIELVRLEIERRPRQVRQAVGQKLWGER